LRGVDTARGDESGDALNCGEKQQPDPVGVAWRRLIRLTLTDQVVERAEQATEGLVKRRGVLAALDDDLDSLRDAAAASDGVIHLAFKHDEVQTGNFGAAIAADLRAKDAMVHTLDAARLFRLAIERAPAGSRLHAVADEGVPFREIAEVIRRHLGVPAVSIPPAEVAGYFGFLAMFVGLHNPASSARTRELLDWQPEHPGLLDDLAQGHYFQATS
jgi:hypothetical protein